jgi:hypothetical protein
MDIDEYGGKALTETYRKEGSKVRLRKIWENDTDLIHLHWIRSSGRVFG